MTSAFSCVCARAIRPWASLLFVLGMGGCAWGEAIQNTLHNDETASIVPTFRYVEKREGGIRYEDISDESVEVVLDNAELPIASGPMLVDCESVLELGLVVRRGQISTSSNKWHDFDFKLTHQDPSLAESRAFAFEKYLRRSYLKGAVRFRGPMRNGSLTISVIHRKEVIYSTDFTITGCDGSSPDTA